MEKTTAHMKRFWSHHLQTLFGLCGVWFPLIPQMIMSVLNRVFADRNFSNTAVPRRYADVCPPQANDLRICAALLFRYNHYLIDNYSIHTVSFAESAGTIRHSSRKAPDLNQQTINS